LTIAVVARAGKRAIYHDPEPLSPQPFGARNSRHWKAHWAFRYVV